MNKLQKKVNKERVAAGQPPISPPKPTPEQLAFDRKQTKLRKQSQLRSIERTIKFKQDQIDSKNIVETQSIHYIPDGTAVRVDGYKDNLKPEFVLINEIDNLNTQAEGIKDQLKNIEELENDGNTSNG